MRPLIAGAGLAAALLGACVGVLGIDDVAYVAGDGGALPGDGGGGGDAADAADDAVGDGESFDGSLAIDAPPSTTSGSLDRTFGTSGAIASSASTGKALVVLPDGRFVVVGSD